MAYRPPPLGPKALRLSASADADLDEILRGLKQDLGLSVAIRFAADFDTDLSRLAHLGHAGASREWLSEGLRIHVFGKYSVYFRVTKTETFVVRILLGRRDIDPSLLSERPDNDS